MVIALIYKITGALAEPMTDSKISAGLNEMGSCVISIGAIMFFTALLFYHVHFHDNQDREEADGSGASMGKGCFSHYNISVFFPHTDT